MATRELAVGPATRSVRDETTRYLCAAAHLDPGFADRAIREFLTEPLRAIPPSPGIDAATVLREAVAARSRRQLRDWLLLAIFVVFAIVNIVLAVGWLVVGAFVGGRSGRSLRTLGIVGAVVVVVFVVLPGVPQFRQLFAQLGLGSMAGGVGSVSVGPAEVGLGLLALVVVGLDEFALWNLLNRSFRRGQFRPDPTVESWPGERWVRTLGREPYSVQLGRVADADVNGNVVTYRGYEPFVGAGFRHNPFSLAISLEPAEDDRDDAASTEVAAPEGTPPREPVPFTLTELYEHVSGELLALRDAASLAPSARLGGLTERGQVIVPIEELMVNLDDPETEVVLPSLDSPPTATVDDRRLASLAEHPREWMRYYRWYRIETWDRELTVSAYLHFGASDRTLYLEWTPCVLLPIASRYRTFDQVPIAPLGPLRDALTGWVGLPAALLGRLGPLFSRIRPLPDLPGLIRPAKYGTSSSLRELATGIALTNYFQRADIDRYLKVLEGRLIRAVGEFLEERNISVTDFMEQASSVVSNHTYITGPVTNSAIGDGNAVHNHPGPSGPN